MRFFNRQPGPPSQTPPELEIKTTMLPGYWQEGTIEPGGFSFKAKVSNEPSPVTGIDGGQVFKLSIRDEAGEIARYERGWDEQPAPGSPGAAAVARVVEFYRDHAHELPFDEAMPMTAAPRQSGTVNPNAPRLFDKPMPDQTLETSDHDHGYSLDEDEGRGL